MSDYNLFSQRMSEFCRSGTRFIIFIPRPVTTSYDRFFAVPVRGSCILKPSGTGPVRGPSKKGNRTETGPDFKALIVIAWSVFHFFCSPFSFRSRARQPVLSFEAELLVCLSSTVFDPLELPRRCCVVCSRRDYTAHQR